MKHLYLVAIFGLFVGCAQLDSSLNSCEDSEACSAEAVVTSINSIADEVGGGGFAYNNYKTSGDMYADFFRSLLIDKAYAAACSTIGRAVDQACVSNVKEAVYDNCSFGQRLTINGSVKLEYNDGSVDNVCSFTSGTSVTRTYNVLFSGPRGGSLQITSESQNNYLGQPISGGGTLTNNGSNNYTAKINGKTKIIKVANTELLNVNISSTDMTITGGLARANRTLDGGVISVYHNLLEATATYSPHNLAWTSTCCHPVSGSIDVTWSGSRTGSGTIEFSPTCGEATVTKDDETKSISITYCE